MSEQFGIRSARGLCVTALAIALGWAVPAFAQRALPATKAFADWLDQERQAGRPAFSNPLALGAGLELAQARARELRALMERDPEAFTRQAMPAAERERLPPQLQSLIEQRLKGRGFFGVACAGLPKHLDSKPGEDHAQHRGHVYEVQLNGVQYRAFAFGKWRDERTVYDAVIEGVSLGDGIALGDASTPSEQAANGEPVGAYTPSTTGPNTLLYMIARFSDQTNDPVSEATALSHMVVVSNFWMNNSSGIVSLRGLVNSGQVMDIVHVVLPQPASYAATYNNNFSLLLSDARAAANAAGFNYANYNLDLLVTTGSGFSYAGYAWIGGQGAHCVAGYTSLRTSGHELGHNLGLWHANYWRTDATQPFGRDSVPGGYVADTSNTEWIEYGHYFSVMSAQSSGEMNDATLPHYATAEKARLGWLSGGEVQYVNTSGSYRLYRHDHASTVGTPRAMRIETPASDYTGYGRRYWLNYRYAPWSVGQSWLRNGVQVDVCQTSYGNDGAIQLDMTPFSKDVNSGASYTSDNTDKLDGALIVGRTYSDVPAGIHITPIATGNFGTNEEYIDVVVNLGTFPGNHPPVISAFTVSTNQVAANQAVNFAVTAVDPDGDSLAYAWDFDQVQVWTASGLNGPSAAKSWSSPGQYRVVVTVSDRKGGVATESVIVAVGNPANNRQIWGRVLWGGSPVYGARVWTTAGSTVYQAWTDSDGSYVLTDLADTNTYSLKCAKAGLTFTAQFSNPVSVTAGNAFANDFYANEPLGGGSSAAGYSISGQVTYGGSGVSGVELQCGGFITTTDGSGNYQFTNFPNGSYTVTAFKPTWTFSPATRNMTVASANVTGQNFARLAPYTLSGRVDGPPAQAQSPSPVIYLSNGRSVGCTRDGTGGNRYWGYSLTDVPAGQFSVSAELSGYNIVPNGFNNPLAIGGNLANLNFNGTVTTSSLGAVSGLITERGLPLSGVTVEARVGGVTVGNTTTDAEGGYRLVNLTNGAYTVVATRSGYTISPSSISVTALPAFGRNFTATGPGSPPSIGSFTASPSTVPNLASTTVLTATATGAGPLTYHWGALTGPGPVSLSANNSTVNSTTVAFQAAGAYTFRVRVTATNNFSTTATVNVVVTADAGTGSLAVSPYEVQVAAGQSVAFSTDAWDQLGNPLSVSPTWSVSGGGSVDANGGFFATTPGGPYEVTAVAGALSATGFVWVTVGSTNPIPPAITSQPLGQSVAVGSNATFSVVASGTAPLNYQWWFGGSPIAGATGTSYTRNNAQPGDAGNYSVVVTNAAGTATSSNALLTVIQPPVITMQPANQVLALGGTAVFNVTASGTAPLRYQWRLNGAPITGATANSYTRADVQVADAGNYSVQVTNAAGVVISSSALLTVPLAGTTGLLVSSTNPSLPAQTVVFSFTVNAVAPAVGVPTGVVQFKVDGTNAGALVALVGGTVAQTNASLAHGSHTIIAEYAGDANFLGTTNQLASDQLVNTPPVAGSDVIERDPTNEVQVSVGTLLDNDSDADGDLVAFLGVAASSANGGTLLSNSGWISYIPLSGFTNTDTFTYTISDGLGPPVTGTATVNVRVDNGPSPNLVITPWGGGTYSIRGDGIPFRTYRIQYLDELLGTNWQTLGTATSDANGGFERTDAAGSSHRFYRSVYP